MAIVDPRTLRVPLLASCLLSVVAASAAAQERVGISSAVNPQARGTPPSGTVRQLVVGQDILFNERITTSGSGQTQVLFLDESSMTIGPNSDVVIDEFVYDPKSGAGKLAMSTTRGLLRYVGGKLSKQDGAVTLRTGSAVLAVRGGAFIAHSDPAGKTDAIFIYGEGLSVIGANAASQTLRRPGFQVTVSGPGATPSAPTPVPPGLLAQFLEQLDGQAGATGGASVVPTSAAVVQSGISQTLSDNVAESLRQAVQHQQAALTAAPTIPADPAATLLATNQVNTVSSQAINCTVAGTCSGQQVINIPPAPPLAPAPEVAVPPTPPPAPAPEVAILPAPPPPPAPPAPPPPPAPEVAVPPAPPPPPATVTIAYAGRLKNTNGQGTARGFIDQSANGDIAYAAGTLSFAEGAPQNGIFTGTFGSLGTISFPLLPGSASFGPQGTASAFGTFSGTSFLSADNTFFYAYLTPTGQPTERLFVYGGIPVASTFYQPTGSTRIFSFTVQPDAALQARIPFVRGQAGGNLPGASVSPLYVVAPPSTAIGDAAGSPAARGLQASLAVSGRGATQQSAIAVTTGTIAALQDTGQPVFSGGMRGSSLQIASGRPIGLEAAVGTPVDGGGNAFYGDRSVTGFVLDQTGFASTATAGTVAVGATPGTAREVSLAGTTRTYGFAHPVLASSVPAAIGDSRSTRSTNGHFGGLMYTNAQRNPYIITGDARITTDAQTNRVEAGLSGRAQSASSGVSTLAAQYGGLAGGDGGNQAFVDDRNFAALESRSNPAQVNGAPAQAASLYLVSSGVAGTADSLLPSGASYCRCQYLQWGYWGGDVRSAGTADATWSRVDRGHINTWIAGVPTPQADLNSLIGASATATYSGHAIGSVFNNGASYVAAGGFAGTYNFGTQTGTMGINNFDGHSVTLSGGAPLSGANYNFASTSAAGTAKLNGTFYGPNAAETGGNFSFQSAPGLSPYLASGIYAGKR